MIPSHHPRGEALRKKLTSSALLGATGLALLATAPAADAAVGAGRAIEAVHGSNLVLLDGYPDGTKIEAVRGGNVIGVKNSGVNGGEGNIALNHGAGECWDASTPDVQPGDVIRATLPGVGGAVDEMTIANVNLDVAGITVAGTTMTLPVNVPAAGDYGFRIVFDSAPRFDTGLNLPAGASAPTVTLSAAQAAAWDPDADEASLEMIGGAGGNEITVSDAIATTAAPDCPAMNVSAVTQAPDSLLNASETTTISGVASTGITAQVSIDGVNVGPAHTGGWSQVITPANIPGADNTPKQVVVTYSGAGAPAAQSFAIAKDVTAPAAPTASRTGNSVALAGAGTIRYTNDGSAAGPASTAYTGTLIPLSVGTTRIRAVAIDAAGNVSQALDQSFTVDAPQQNTNQNTTQQTQTQTQAQPQQQAQAPAPIVTVAPTPVVAPSRSLTARSLSVPGRQKLRTVRRGGLKFAVRVSNGTRFLGVRLVRVSGKKRTTVTSRALRVSAAGLFSGKLKVPASLKAGKYELEVAPADSNQLPGRSTKATFRIA